MFAVTIAFAGGCASSASVAKPHDETVNVGFPAGGAANGSAPAPATVDQSPRIITNLNQLSALNTAPPIVDQQALLASGTPALDTKQTTSGRSAVDTNLARLFLADPNSQAYHEGPQAAGDTILLNNKARQFPEFSYALLNRTLTAMQRIETATYNGRKLPDEIKPVILIAVMTPQGQLTDLTIDQRSGVAVVDRSVIDACKKALFALSPPPDARFSDGSYRMRFEALVKNHTYDREGQYDYVTHVGLAVL